MAERSRIIDLKTRSRQPASAGSGYTTWLIGLGGIVCLAAALAFYMVFVRQPDCPSGDEAFALIQQDALRQMPQPDPIQPGNPPTVRPARTDSGECRYTLRHRVSGTVSGVPMEVDYDASASWNAESRSWTSAYASLVWGD